MDTQPDQQRIVVGFDGSPEAGAALDWAVDEAERTGCRLHIVHAYQVGWPIGYFDQPTAPAVEHTRRRADQVVAAAVAAVRARRPGLPVTGTAVHDAPAPALILTGTPHTRLIVVGNRGAGGVAGLLLGSVSRQVASHSYVPVAVVRGRATAGPVVVGTDGSPAADAALESAFAAAEARHAPLVAVRAYVPPATQPAAIDGLEATERAALDASLQGWRDKYPGVAVTASLGVGSPGPMLINRSRGAQLLVVGSRGRGVLTALLLGSTGHQLMQHAACPVIVAHTRTAA
ncbi:universal stress protein [Dactylosporangium matsuzakiense]|uniref:Universal stress protein n=1 Tax=Dactylosporangium matsuzakiense TaxID=53360 RepID=A0A9W6KGA1_9ACTN|nr:universal stress protein [Dactylosporangium matsuzakiense]UWZ48290.1 universal stress protein [Dactylosporangium matsuzakiense]GLL01532.1 universal stress protein [Dactylosporangium matsuzakiense]